MFVSIMNGLSIGFAAGITTGPLQIFLFTQTLQHGWRHAIWLTLSPLLSDLPVIVLILLVLQNASDNLLRLIMVLGGAYVFYLAWGLYGQLRRDEITVFDPSAAAAAPRVVNRRRALRRAVTINVLGPGVWTFWSTAAGPTFIAAWRENPFYALAFVGSFYGLFLGTMAVQVLAVHQAHRFGPRAMRRGLWLGLAAMCLFALSLWVQAATY